MPVGIENLATGFLQGLNARKQQDRQDVIDQREAERFDMQKEQFAGQQAANALSLKTNQFQLGQAQKTADRDDITWNQQQDEINRKKAFESDLRTIYSLEKEGNTEGLANFLTQKNKTLGIKGDFERDYVTGKGALKLDKDGKAVFVHEDGTRTVYDMDDYGADFVAKFDPVTAISNKQKTAAEIAKEDRLFQKEVKLVGLNAANAEKLAYINNKAKDRQLDKQINWRRNQSQNTIGYDTNGNMVLVDKNTGETMPVRGGISTKPPVKLPSTALKMQQELVDTIGTLGATNTRLSNIVGQLESGKLDLSPTARAAAYVRNNTNNSNENSRNLSALQATLEELRNASLRLNTGVQTDGDAQRAWSEIAANPNDTELVKSRLKFIVQKNQEAAQLKKLQIEQLRQNFSQPQLQNYGDGGMGGQSGGQDQVFDFNDLPD